MTRLLAVLLLLLLTTPSWAQRPDEVIVRVNGKPITAAPVLLRATALKGNPDDLTAEARAGIVEELIDIELKRQFLVSKKIQPDPNSVEVRNINAVIRQALAFHNKDPDEVFTQLRLTDEVAVAACFGHPGWEQYVKMVITEQQIREVWDKHRQEYDGTRIEASQIFVKTQSNGKTDEAQVEQGLKLLADLRQQIEAGTLTFGAAAGKHSQSPSSERGGRMAEFEYSREYRGEYSGQVDPAISAMAFALPLGGISQPFRSTLGVHLVQTHDRIPGQLSLEDARSKIIKRLSGELWVKTLAELRKTAKIERLAN